MPNRVKRFRTIQRRQNSADGRLGLVESVSNRLREVGDVDFSGPKRPESRLRVE